MIRKHATTAFLSSLVAAITALDVWWRTLDQVPPHWDEGIHLGDSVVYLRLFNVHHPGAFFRSVIGYPPLVNWVTDLFFALLHNEAIWVAVLSNVVWTALLVFSTYGLGATLWNRRVGLMSVAFVLASPMIVTTLKDYMFDTPLTATVALALYFLVRSDAFSSRRYSLLFGVACGLGLMVKWTFPLVMALPVVLACATATARSRRERTLEPVVNLCGAAVGTFVIAGFWYVPKLHYLAGETNDKAFAGAPTGLPSPLSLESACWYFWTLLDQQLYLIPFLFFAAGVVVCFLRRDFASRNAYLIVTVVGTYVAFTCLRDKDSRFTLPMLPAVAVIATSWLERLRARPRRALAVGLVAYATASFFAVNFAVPVLPKDVSIRLGPGPLLGTFRSFAAYDDGKTVLFSRTQPPEIIGPPLRQNWHQEDPFRVLERLPRADRRLAYFGPRTIWFNQYGLRYYALRYNTKRVSVPQARFVLVRGTRLPRDVRLRALDRWRLPDGEPLVLYRRLTAS